MKIIFGLDRSYDWSYDLVMSHKSQINVITGKYVPGLTGLA